MVFFTFKTYFNGFISLSKTNFPPKLLLFSNLQLLLLPPLLLLLQLLLLLLFLLLQQLLLLILKLLILLSRSINYLQAENIHKARSKRAK